MFLTTLTSLLGVFLIILALYVLRNLIRIGKKVFNPIVIVNLPYEVESATFVLTKVATYSVYRVGKLFTNVPLDKFRPHIIKLGTGLPVQLHLPLFKTKTSSFSTSSIELFTFHGVPGKYQLTLIDGSSVSGFERVFTVPLANALMPSHAKSYSIQIRPSATRDVIAFILLIFATIFSAIFGILLLVSSSVYGFSLF